MKLTHELLIQMADSHDAYGYKIGPMTVQKTSQVDRLYAQIGERGSYVSDVATMIEFAISVGKKRGEAEIQACARRVFGMPDPE